MRTVGILVLLCFVVTAAGGCKNKSDAAARDPEAIKAQQELVARRDALLAEQQRMQDESKALEVQIEVAKSKGEDVAALTQQKTELDQKIQGSETELNTTSDQLSVISSKLDDAGAERERRIAEREARVLEREKAVLSRMDSLIKLEAESASRWKEGCSVGGSTIIQQVAPPKGGTYTRREVDALVKRAKTAMAKKGLMGGDLGAQSGLEGEVTKAQQDSDWTRAYVLASQLVQTVDAIQINRPFISAKYQRLHNRVKAAKVDEATQATLTSGMQEVMQKYGDGDFDAANRRINQLWNNVK